MTETKKAGGYAKRRAANERMKTNTNAARVAALNEADEIDSDSLAAAGDMYDRLNPGKRVVVFGPYVTGTIFDVHATGCDHPKRPRPEDKRILTVATLGDVVRAIYPNSVPADWRRYVSDFQVFECINLNPATPNQKEQNTMSTTADKKIHEALNPTPAKRGAKKAAPESQPAVESPAERTARMKAIAEGETSTPTNEAGPKAAPTKRTTAKKAATPTLMFVEGIGTTAAATPAKATSKKGAAPAKSASKSPAPAAKATKATKRTRSTRPEADEAKIKSLTAKLLTAEKIEDKDKRTASRTAIVDDMLDAGATWTAIADARKVSMSTARGQHRRAGGRVTR